MKLILCILVAALLCGCQSKTVLEPGGAYDTLGATVYSYDELARDYYQAMERFNIWASSHENYVNQSSVLLKLRASVDKQLTPPAESDEPLVVYFRLRDAWVKSRSSDDLENLDTQAAVIQAAITQLLTAIQ